MPVTAQEIREDCCKAQAESGHESSDEATVTVDFLRLLSSSQAGYMALLLPLTFNSERTSVVMTSSRYHIIVRVPGCKEGSAGAAAGA